MSPTPPAPGASAPGQTGTTSTDGPASTAGPAISGHGGEHGVAVSLHHGTQVMWTLSGAHIFPLLDAAVGGRARAEQVPDAQFLREQGPMRLIDTRHESTAVFAAEATGKLTRNPGLAVVTAGPGVTNSVSAITSARFNGSPLVVLGGRAPQSRWGSGALQELDHPAILDPITKSSTTVADPDQAAATFDQAFRTARSPHRGPVFVDAPMDVLFSYGTSTMSASPEPEPVAPDPAALADTAAALARAHHPVVVLGGDVWAGHAERAARDFVDELRLPVIVNGMGRGLLPPGHPGLVTRARSRAFAEADLVVVVGAPLDFRLGYGSFGGRDGSAPAAVIHIVDSPDQIAGHTEVQLSVTGDLGLALTGIAETYPGGLEAEHREWLAALRGTADGAAAADNTDLTSAADPIHPARIYGELRSRLADDAVVIGDGGDFVSFAGKYLEPERPGQWLDPGPFGCLGTGLGYAMSARVHRPESQVVLLLGDGAAGFSLMDIDTLVRHNLPAVIVVGNNSAWGLEKHPMRFLYGYDVAAELQPTRYDQVVTALGGAGEQITDPGQIGEALDRAFDAGVPYLINVMTDPNIAYPRATTGV